MHFLSHRCTFILVATMPAFRKSTFDEISFEACVSALRTAPNEARTRSKDTNTRGKTIVSISNIASHPSVPSRKREREKDRSVFRSPLARERASIVREIGSSRTISSLGQHLGVPCLLRNARNTAPPNKNRIRERERERARARNEIRN